MAAYNKIVFRRLLQNATARQIRNVLIIFLLIFVSGGIILFWQIQKLASQVPLSDIKEQQLFLAQIGLWFIAVIILIIGLFLIFFEKKAWLDGFKNGYEKGKIDGEKKTS